MRKIKYIVCSILAFMVTLLGITNANAEDYSGSIKTNGYMSGPYYYMHVEGTRKLWDQVNELIRTSDGQRVYCIQPFAEISSKGKYKVTTEDIEQALNLSFENWKLISKVAYYGWEYQDETHDHRDDKWYVATQMLLWKIAAPNVDSYFTSTLKGERNDLILKNEMDEIMALANNHLLRPEFADFPTSMPINQTITLTDSRNVLANYTIANVSGGLVTKSGNTLSITANSIGNLSFSLQKLGNRYGERIEVYYAVDYQNALHKGNIDPVNIPYSINVYGGDVSIEKTDSETYLQQPQGEASLEGAVYGIYKEDGTKVTTITTNSNGYAKSSYLPEIGRYYLQEEKASTGYELDKRKYYFDISNDNLHPDVQVFESVIKRKYDITKVYADANTGIMTPEPNVKFGFYNNKNELVQELTTDSQGNIKISLPYGTYKVKQLTTTQGYEKVKDFTITISSSGDDIRMIISNAEITARLKVVKLDAETGNIVTKRKIKFKIFNEDTNKYVRQTITYPKAQTIEVFETDENGILITPYPLNQGNYYLEEVDQPINGYLWNKQKIKFSINGNANFIDDENYGTLIQLNFSNTPVKGKINLNKVGESVKFTDDGYDYIFKNLANIKFGLYAGENITDGTGIKKFNKDDLIMTGVTNQEGKINFENLYLGKYYLKELETDSSHVLLKDKISVELKYKDQYTAVVNYSVDLKNYLKKGTLEFTKSDIANGKLIPNTKIEIYTEDDKFVFEGVTNEDGKITIPKLFLGKYYIIETEPATGYRLSDEKVFFEIKEDGEIVKANMTNEKVKGTLEFTKVDISTGEVLPNTTIQIYTIDNELVFEGVTDENGKIIVPELEYGKYYILEKNAPEGYILNLEKMFFEILNDGEIVKATMTNEKIVIDVPITELDKNYIPCVIGLSFVMIGIGIILYANKSKKK